MPKIKPFYGIRPNAGYAGKVVLEVENLSLEQAKIIRQENPYSYVNMLVPKLDNLFLRGSKHELAFKKINENFEEFLEEGVLIRESKPSIYVYRVSKSGCTQTGIWTVTAVDDYLSNKIKKHELTRPERENVLIDYLQQTGIDANPVLITYHSVPKINELIQEACKADPVLSFNTGDTLHQLWKMDDGLSTAALIKEFQDIPSAYIADGHHRAAAASRLALEQRSLNPQHTGSEEYNFFTSVYMASDQLKIYPFHRLVKDLNGKSNSDFVEHLKEYFLLENCEATCIPEKLHEFGMYLGGQWYRLSSRTDIQDSNNPVAELDVAILQEAVFANILDIHDPRSDPRIMFSGGPGPIDELVDQVDRTLFAVLFVLYPTSIDQLIKVAEKDQVMPPKSTWFEPKFQAGLLIHKIN